MDFSDHYLGLDFGTSNSYCCLTTQGFLSSTPVHIYGNSSISTSILWEIRDDGSRFIKTFGDKAEEEWGLTSKSEKKKLSLRTMFKPDISHSKTARADAAAFLTELGTYLKQQAVLPRGKSPGEMNVLVGSPANVLPDFEGTLKTIARDSGFGDIRIVKEPIGALVHHVGAKQDVTPAHTRQGVLVIDFGGGTCDIAFMLRLEIKCAWGDPMLGGRLFDDLFYQWFIDTNPGMRKMIQSDENAYYIHWVISREIKERFSITMDRNRSESFTYHVHVGEKYYGALKDATWDQFMDRASHYHPDADLLKLMTGAQNVSPELMNSPVNLVTWFRKTVETALISGDVNLDHIHWIILTGGSSAWPFVREAVLDIFQVDPQCLLSSPNPQSAVGEGIALLPVIQDLHRTAQTAIKAEQEEKISEIHMHVNQIVDQFIQTASSELTGLVVDREVFPLIQQFSRNGGKVRDLKQQIENQLIQTTPEFESILKIRAGEVEAAINQRVIDILLQWFLDNGIRNSETGTRYLDSLAISHSRNNSVKIDDPLYQSFAIIGTLVTGTLSSAILGGGGTALLAAGPHGLAAGFFIGIVISSLGLILGKKTLKGWTESMHIPRALASFLFSENRLDKIMERSKEKIRRDLQDAILKAYAEQSEILEQRITDLVTEQIDSLSALNHL